MGSIRRAAGAVLVATAFGYPNVATATGYTLLGWNTVGMHCIDADYSVFSLFPPDNTIHAQLIDAQGRLVRSPAGITVTYEAVADPDGLIDTTSAGKTNFWDHAPALFGIALPIDTGLSGSSMPGKANHPQPTAFDAAAAWFTADGIPITPYADSSQKSQYPLMRLVARDSLGSELARTDIVLPVSEEMDCKGCHASGSDAAAQPGGGWVNDADPQRDTRLNILRLHDEREAGTDAFRNALAAAGYDAAGLFATASTGVPILCARCHVSAALPNSGLAGIEPLTQAVHRRMAGVVDPATGLVLDAIENRAACIRCHPGSMARGAMTSAVAADGSRAMQCQSCHGSMLDVAAASRVGWIDEPACQSCHTGPATHNNGEIRYLSAFAESGQPRLAVDSTFATPADTATAKSVLYQLADGHGGLACAACHGSPHAEFPSSQRNDNLQNTAVQGHVGMLVECESCHASAPMTTVGGPHGMHPVGQEWVNRHPDIVGEGGGSNAMQCQACHGVDYRGTVLSRVQNDRTLNAGELGSKQLWRGFQIGCYTCHLGPDNSDRNPNRPALVGDVSASTTQDTPVSIPLNAADPDGNALTVRVVSQPSHGTAGADGMTAQYVPDAGFTGTDSFTFAAWDGSTDSNLGVVTVTVNRAPVATPTATLATAAPSTATASRAPTATPSGSVPFRCAGDCDGKGAVSVADLVTGVQIALGGLPLSHCAAFDVNGDGRVTIDELIAAVAAALSGCSMTPTTVGTMGGPSPTPSIPTMSPPPTGAGTPTTTPTQSSLATLANIQATIFTTTCTDATCHSAQLAQGGLVLEAGMSYASLVNAPAANLIAQRAGLLRVKPGDPDHSFLIIKLTGPPPGEGSLMPLGKPALTAAQIQLIRDWISAGSPS